MDFICPEENEIMTFNKRSEWLKKNNIKVKKQIDCVKLKASQHSGNLKCNIKSIK